MRTLFQVRPVGLISATMLILAFWPGITEAQYREGGKVGVSAAVQSDQVEIMLPMWTSGGSVVTPSFAVRHESDEGTWYKLGLSIRFNFGKGKVAPYLGVHAAAATVSEDGEDSYTDVIMGPLFGGEYFLDEHFSLGVEARVNVTLQDDRKVYDYYYDPYYGYTYPSYWYTAKGHTLVTTATMVMATFYF